MTKLPSLILITAVGMLLAADDPKKVPETIQGTWHAVEINREGVISMPAEDKAAKLVITADKITQREGGKEQVTQGYKLDTTQKPIAIDLMIQIGDETKEIKGIVEVDGDKLKLCYGRAGTDRPASFDPQAGSRHRCITFKREKK